ncbi:sigma-54 interaction domain-containing protein [Diplocloster modestus]|uniref:Sigma 54-interacting transcriptional regulator n=1 Tax=Diplocloster modestus TaxID=2850322 RepID=A0ABS6K6Q8_9FIRM|nr:sigma 54-interacting transcriptional regulator [Diplocloster modestus]MBU9726231.1 sigma 54-interacting transcriptional regulator [Diplocloster modestus]
MEFTYDENTIRKYKHSFLKGELLEKGVVSDNIYQSWVRCRQSNVDASQKVLIREATDTHTPNDILESSRYIRKQSEYIYQMKFDLLSKIGIAVFYLNRNLSVFSKGGNRKLLDELKSKNLRFSTNMSENLVGTNAAALAVQGKKSCIVIGEEHYTDVLSDYVTIAFPYFRTFPQSKIFAQDAFINLYIMPVKLADDLHFSVIRYLGSLDFYTDPSHKLKDLMSEFNAKANHSCYILLDQAGIIMDVNILFCEAFDICQDMVCGKRPEQLYPELGDIMKRLYRQEKVKSCSIVFNSLSAGKNEFYVDAMPMTKDQKLAGYIIVLTDSRHVQRYVNRLVNKGAYYTFDSLIGKNRDFEISKRMAARIASGNSNVLICGESGTGKELFAQSIHNASDRSHGPFVSINCAALPKELISSELFGYEEGAFTGARKGGSMGKFEQANQGTLFLDEIAEMPLDMQSVLLRVIEERTVSRLGGSQPRSVDVRIIAATNRDLMKYIEENKFRLDLYYRLNVMRLDLIPLRNHIDDIPLLVDHFIRHFNESAHKSVRELEPRAMECLMKYSWPGNIRELRNVMERCVNLSVQDIITLECLPAELLREQAFSQTSQQFPLPMQPDMPEQAFSSQHYNSYEEYECQRIVELMKQYKGNRTQVAQELGISRATLYRKMKKISNWN